MMDFNVVATADLHPRRCICGDTRGPFVNTWIDLHAGPGIYGRVYICEKHAKDVARVMGLVEGPRMEELLAASSSLRNLETQLEHKGTQVEELRALNYSMSDSLTVSKERVGWLEGRVAQLEGRMRETAEAELELVGAGQPSDNTRTYADRMRLIPVSDLQIEETHAQETDDPAQANDRGGEDVDGYRDNDPED